MVSQGIQASVGQAPANSTTILSIQALACAVCHLELWGHCPNPQFVFSGPATIPAGESWMLARGFFFSSCSFFPSLSFTVIWTPCFYSYTVFSRKPHIPLNGSLGDSVNKKALTCRCEGKYPEKSVTWSLVITSFMNLYD